MNAKEKLLFELSPGQFEQLCVDLLEREGYLIIKKADSTLDYGFDLVGRYQENEETKEIAVAIKHKINLSSDEIQIVLNKFFHILTAHNTYLLMTSSNLTESQREIISHFDHQIDVNVIDRKKLLLLVEKYPEIKDKYFKPVIKELRERKIRLYISIAAVVISSVGVFTSFQGLFITKKPLLSDRIQKVKSALSNIKDLEGYLKSLKEEMVETDEASRLITEKYEKAKKLEKLTNDQLEAVRLALESERWKRDIFTLLMGFLLGIGSSFIGSILYSSWKQKRAVT